jgi:hypothetical protein
LSPISARKIVKKVELKTLHTPGLRSSTESGFWAFTDKFVAGSVVKAVSKQSESFVDTGSLSVGGAVRTGSTKGREESFTSNQK